MDVVNEMKRLCEVGKEATAMTAPAMAQVPSPDARWQRQVVMQLALCSSRTAEPRTHRILDRTHPLKSRGKTSGRSDP